MEEGLIGDVGAGEGQVLKSSHKTPVLSSIADRRSIFGGDFCMSVKRRAADLALCHNSPLKNVQNVLSLRHEQAIRTPVN